MGSAPSDWVSGRGDARVYNMIYIMHWIDVFWRKADGSATIRWFCCRENLLDVLIFCVWQILQSNKVSGLLRYFDPAFARFHWKL